MVTERGNAWDIWTYEQSPKHDMKTESCHYPKKNNDDHDNGQTPTTTKDMSIYQSVFHDTTNSIVESDSRVSSNFHPPTKIISNLDNHIDLSDCELNLSICHQNHEKFTKARLLVEDYLGSSKKIEKMKSFDSNLVNAAPGNCLTDFLQKAIGIVNTNNGKPSNNDTFKHDLSTVAGMHRELDTNITHALRSCHDDFAAAASRCWQDYEARHSELFRSMVADMCEISDLCVDRLVDGCRALMPQSLTAVLVDILRMMLVSTAVEKCRIGNERMVGSIGNSGFSKRTEDKMWQIFGGFKIDSTNTQVHIDDPQCQRDGFRFELPVGGNEVFKGGPMARDSPASGSPIIQGKCPRCDDLSQQLTTLNKKYTALKLELDFNKLSTDELTFLRQDKDRLDMEIKDMTDQLGGLTDTLECMQGYLEEYIVKTEKLEKDALDKNLKLKKKDTEIEKILKRCKGLFNTVVDATETDLDRICNGFRLKIGVIEDKISNLRAMNGVSN